MTSNELNEILNKTRRTKDISLTPEQVEELIKTLEELEEYRKIMGTPIQDIMKRLRVLEILKESFDLENCNGKIYFYCGEECTDYLLEVNVKNRYGEQFEEKYDLVKEYLEK